MRLNKFQKLILFLILYIIIIYLIYLWIILITNTLNIRVLYFFTFKQINLLKDVAQISVIK
jgi:hypothetical protein